LRRFNPWSKKGVLSLLFNKLVSSDTDSEWLFIDGNIVDAHQRSLGATSQHDESIGNSRGGNSNKILLAVDCFGSPVDLELSGGHAHDVIHADNLLSSSP